VLTALSSLGCPGKIKKSRVIPQEKSIILPFWQSEPNEKF